MSRSERGQPSAFFEAHFAVLAETTRLGPMLDLACGRGRHAVAAAERGMSVVALDREMETLKDLLKVAVQAPGVIEVVCLDLETSETPSLGDSGYGAIVVSRYLHRPLMSTIESALAPGGVLLYETFTTAQRELGWGPRRDDFLLKPGELAGLLPTLETLVYEEGASGDSPSAETARLLARRPG